MCVCVCVCVPDIIALRQKNATLPAHRNSLFTKEIKKIYTYMCNCQSSTSTMPAQIRICIKWHVRIHLCIHVRQTEISRWLREEGGGGGGGDGSSTFLGNCFWTQECISRSLSLLVSVSCGWVYGFLLAAELKHGCFLALSLARARARSLSLSPPPSLLHTHKHTLALSTLALAHFLSLSYTHTPKP
jgi:hypothetical protein